MRGRVERSTEDFQKVVSTMDAVAMRTELLPVADGMKKLQAELVTIAQDVLTKAAEEDVIARLDEINSVQTDHKAQLLTKADSVAVQERHERHVQESTNAINGLREVTEHLGISINSVEESVNLVAAQTGTKAETRDVHEMIKMNEGVQTQVASLKAELQGTLKSLETWILEQNTKKGNGVKLQPKPADTSASNNPAGKAGNGKPTDASGGAGDAAATAAQNAAQEKLQHRVSELERQLAETQALLYAQAGAQGIRGPADGPFAPGFPPPPGVPHAGSINTTGDFQMPDGGAAPQYQPMGGSGLTPRPPPRSKNGSRSSAVGGGGNAAQAPPFQSQSDRRQYLLQEKRKWLVEMRLGGGGDGGEIPTPSKLPPIPSGGAALSNGTDLATLATPR